MQISIAKSPTFKKKLHIKHMLVFKRTSKRKNVVDIALLLDNNQYVEYTMPFKQKLMSFWVANRIIDTFSKYIIDERTDIMTNEELSYEHPISIYLSILRPHIQFKLRVVSTSQIANRIYYYFFKKKATKSKLNAVWKATIQREVCPWITQKVDYALQNKTPTTQHVMKVMRLGVFYMVIKNYLYNIVQKSRKNSKAPIV